MSECPVKHGGASGCPVKHESSKGSRAPVRSPPAECPVSGKSQAYDVYNRPVKVNPDNQMPFNPNQVPAPGQKIDLSTHRVKSTIPKAGGDTWLFPSPQMFYNAMRRKGKTVDEGESHSLEELEEEVGTVVAVHNNMNEKTWRQILAWETLHENEHTEDGGPRLVRFLGRPDDLTPKAKLRALLGGPMPFDRHDWYVKRGEKES